MRAASLGLVLHLVACTASAPPVVQAAPAPAPVPAPVPAPASAEPPAPTTDAGTTTSLAALTNVFLGNLHVERGGPGNVGATTGAKLALQGNVTSMSAELRRRGLRPVRTDDASVELALHGYPTAPDAPRPRDRAPSFVVDFDTDVVREVAAQASVAHGDKPSMRDLASFVSTFVTKKNLARGYDPASVVAKRREGDCSEHAVLLAALGRSFGHAVRLVHGLVVVEANGQLMGGMHAWVESYDGKRWAPFDGAIREALDPVYLPLQTLVDESPAFGRQFLQLGLLELRGVIVTPHQDHGGG